MATTAKTSTKKKKAPESGLRTSNKLARAILGAEPDMAPEDRARIIKGKARLYDLVHRINHGCYAFGTVYKTVGAEFVPGEADWGYSAMPKGFLENSTSNLVVTDPEGTRWSISPGSQDWVFESIEEMLGKIDGEIQAERVVADRKSKALDRARNKLSEEDLVLLGLIK